MQRPASKAPGAVSTLIGILPFVCFFVLFLILLWPIQLRGGSDDTAHAATIIDIGRLQWVWLRATTWQPRIPSDLAYALFVFHLPVWKWVNAFVMTMLLWVITRIALVNDPAGRPDRLSAPRSAIARVTPPRFLTMAVFVCLFFFLIHPNVVTSGSVWFTGSVNYLWPVTAMLLGLMPFIMTFYGKAPPAPRLLIPVCILFSLCASFTEQTAAVQLGVALLIVLWLALRRERIPRALIIHFALIVVASAVFFFFDFASPRVTQHQELPLFPESANFGILDKTLLGVNVYSTHLLHISNVLFAVFIALAAWAAFRRIRDAHVARASRFKPVHLLVFLPAIWALVNTLPLPWGYTQLANSAIEKAPGALGFGVSNWLGFLYATPPMSSSPSPGAILLSVLAAACVLSPLYLLYRAFSDLRDRALACILYLASFLSGILIGFSPTVWASESRPNFLSNFLILLILAMLVRARIMPGQPNDIAPATSPEALAAWPRHRIVVVAIALLALFVFAVIVWILYHTTFASNDYWWY
ncbi:MAG: DUF6056 family protein [Propionibacteriaceae bacterium]|nr:DUF6056 family protein [Propionibacteriaceae bacterium]